MNSFRDRILPNWHRVLERIRERADQLGPLGVVAFDLDSTLFDNRPRQARILREYGAANGIRPLLECTAKHLDSGWNLKAAFVRCGVAEAEVDRLYAGFKPFWEERFFTSEYCVEDVAVKGAAAYVRTLALTGANIAYVTGRHEGMRQGTETSMRREGMPLDGKGVSLMMKPDAAVDDDAFKRTAHADLGKLGTLIAAFDNEPVHANDYRSQFPQAVIVHLATDDSGRQKVLLEGVVSIPHFERPA